MNIDTHFPKICLSLVLCGAVAGCNDTSPGTSTRSTVNSTTGSPTVPDHTDGHSTSPSTDPANTGINVRDRDDAAKTPIDQNENQTDIKITADIRSRVVDTKMSIDAQNCKIITQNGKVTLRGPVKTAAEKQRIEEIATAVAGMGNVDSHLEVKNN